MYCFQICIPGLHISLGLFLKFFDMMKDECEELDIKVAKHKAETANTEGELLTATEFDTYVQTVRDAREHERVCKVKPLKCSAGSGICGPTDHSA